MSQTNIQESSITPQERMKEKLDQAGLAETMTEMSLRVDEFCLREVKWTPEQCKNCPRTPDDIQFCQTRDLKLLINKNNQLLEKLVNKS